MTPEDPNLQNAPCVVRLSGEVDISRYPETEAILASVPFGSRPILIDLRETTLIDSLSLAQLLFAKRRWERSGRRVAVVVSNRHVYRMLSIANVIKTLNVFEDEATAAEFLQDEAL